MTAVVTGLLPEKKNKNTFIVNHSRALFVAHDSIVKIQSDQRRDNV